MSIPKNVLISSAEQATMRKVLKEVAGDLTKNNIQFWLEGGSLLGWKRHNKKFIPWDDDIDLQVRATQEQIQEIFDNPKYNIKSYFGARKTIKGKTRSPQVSLKGSKNWVDLFLVDENNKFRYHKEMPKYGINAFPSNISLTKTKLEGVNVNVPSQKDTLN